MEVSEPISTLPPPDISQSPPSDHLDQPPLTERFQAIVNLKDGDENAPPTDAVDFGHLNEVEEEEDVVRNETRKDGEDETVKDDDEILKDGWSDDGYGRVDGGVDYQNRYKVDGWNDGNGVEEPEWKEEEVQGTDMEVQFPLRPGAEDCNFYMRTGSCKFGFSCKFNHPPRMRNQTIKPRLKEREDSSESSMQIECKYYMSAGGCKYGKACRFNHYRERPTVVPVFEYNFLGLPKRPGEKECPYYMRNGSCKYAANCRFNHPDPTAASDSPDGYANGEQAPAWPLNGAVSFPPIPFSSSQGIHSQNSEWTQGPLFAPERSFRPSPAFGSNIHPMAKSAYSHFQPQLANEEFPERPGQPECTYFLKTGDCKFRSGCKFHHPKGQIVQPSCAMTDKGLPLRPGQSICTHYSSYGICKFGPKCRYDHPLNIQHTAPSVMIGLDRPHHSFSNFASPEDASRLSSIGEGTITL
ncbi:unnamed protein product [Rhodiola kirilowii]